MSKEEIEKAAKEYSEEKWTTEYASEQGFIAGAEFMLEKKQAEVDELVWVAKHLLNPNLGIASKSVVNKILKKYE